MNGLPLGAQVLLQKFFASKQTEAFCFCFACGSKTIKKFFLFFSLSILLQMKGNKKGFVLLHKG
jgi:hypothetical protein